LGRSTTFIKPLPLGSKCTHNSLNLSIVLDPTCRPSSSYEVLKLSRIMAMKRFRKMKETTIMKLMK